MVQSGIRDFCIGVGGSATNDGGIGMAYGLGYRFYDSQGQELEPIGANLGLIKKVSSKNKIDLSGVTIHLITDVDNPLCGQDGATYIFGGQKGLAPSQFKKVDQDMTQFYENFAPEVLKLAGSGAGGGMAAGLVGFAGAEIKSGLDFVIDCVDFDYCLKLVRNGYEIHQVNKIVLHHEIGKKVKKKFVGKNYFCDKHNYIRSFYIVRNRNFIYDE